MKRFLYVKLEFALGTNKFLFSYDLGFMFMQAIIQSLTFKVQSHLLKASPKLNINLQRQDTRDDIIQIFWCTVVYTIKH
jgi:hypothetical protein